MPIWLVAVSTVTVLCLVLIVLFAITDPPEEPRDRHPSHRGPRPRH